VHPKECSAVVDRRYRVRHGSEQPIAGHPSLVGSRGGGGDRDYPHRNAWQRRPSTHSFRSCPESRHAVSKEFGTDRLGERFLRIALRTGLGRERANRAAAGWGNDSFRTYRPRSGGSAVYTWVIRFDDAANRTEFASAFEDSLAARASADAGDVRRIDGTAFDLRSAGDDSAVVLVGTDRFVRNVSVSGSDGNVSIALPE